MSKEKVREKEQYALVGGLVGIPTCLAVVHDILYTTSLASTQDASAAKAFLHGAVWSVSPLTAWSLVK